MNGCGHRVRSQIAGNTVQSAPIRGERVKTTHHDIEQPVPGTFTVVPIRSDRKDRFVDLPGEAFEDIGFGGKHPVDLGESDLGSSGDVGHSRGSPSLLSSERQGGVDDATRQISLLDHGIRDSRAVRLL